MAKAAHARPMHAFRWIPLLAATLALAGCASAPPGPSSDRALPRTAECTDAGRWAGWTGGITASGSTPFCGPRSGR